MQESTIRDVRTIQSDKDSVATSDKFKRTLLRRFGVSWSYLPSRNKAHIAESMIAHVKRALSMALEANPGEKDWTKFVGAIVEKHNNSVVPGTDVRRKSVSKANYMQLLEKLFRSGQPDMLLNVSTSQNISRRLGRFLWKYSLGDVVRVRIGSTYAETRSKFYKTSAGGSFSKRTFVIARRVLKSSGDLFLCPLYRLKNHRGLQYESDLLPTVAFQAPEEGRRRDDAPAADEGPGGEGGEHALPANVERPDGSGLRGKTGRVQRQDGPDSIRAVAPDH